DYVHYMHIKDALEDGTIVPSGKGVGKIADLIKMYQGEILTLEPHLYEFSGLKNLEKQGEESTILQSYKDNREAFDAGVNALKDILKGV
ncbi:MAG: sugar phosphate isomerase/epimerase, partial [Clostridia bacterium]|nr:sugar phosphate isomerase/epimerase [Clostridia bacterium]